MKKMEENKGWVLKERFLNAKNTKAEGTKASETKVSYFKGKDPNNWKANIPTYTEVSFGEVYEHIRLNLRAHGKNIEKIFIVERSVKPEEIRIKVEGAKVLNVQENGELEIETGVGNIKITTPVAYQEINGKRVEVAVNYTLRSSQPTYGFKVGE